MIWHVDLSRLNPVGKVGVTLQLIGTDAGRSVGMGKEVVVKSSSLIRE